MCNAFLESYPATQEIMPTDKWNFMKLKGLCTYHLQIRVFDFPICIPLIFSLDYFFCQDSKHYIEQEQKKQILILFVILTEMFLSFSIMLALPYTYSIVLRYVHSISGLFGAFIIKECWFFFFSCISVSIEMVTLFVF